MNVRPIKQTTYTRFCMIASVNNLRRVEHSITPWSQAEAYELYKDYFEIK